MECFNQISETECSKDSVKNDNIVYKNIAKYVQWFVMVKMYIMNLKWGSLLTKFSQKAILISIFFLVTTLASHYRQNKYQQDFQNCRLFPQHSIVKDYIYGESDLLHDDLITSDMSFVVYYAPWDHDSNTFKSLFYKAAVHFHEQINFASINCWYPEGKCKKTEGLMRFPVIVLHVRLPSNKRAIGIQYTGPLLESHVHRFLNRALKPITYISNQAELDELQLLYQVVILGCFDDDVPSDFYNFYYASLLLLPFPYMTDVVYAATYNSLLCGGRPHIKLISWSKTVNFPSKALYLTNDIVNFVQNNVLLMPKWIPVHEYRSNSLSNLAASGPLLVAFVPDDPHSTVNDAYLDLRSVVLEYFNCKNDSKVNNQIEKLQSLAEKKLTSTSELCFNYSEKSEDYSSPNNLIYTDSWCENSLPNNSNQCNMYGNIEYCLLDEDLWIAKNSFNDYSLLRNFEYYYRGAVSKTKNYKTTSSSCKDYASTHPSLGPIKDEYVTLAKKWFMEDQCNKKPHSSSSVKKSKPGSIVGISCSSNKTFNFVALNSLQKADLFSNSVKFSSAWIIDSYAEELYYLRETFSRDSLVNFIYNYTHGLLPREVINTSSVENTPNVPNRLMLVELNAKNYLNVTQELGNSFVVLHYAAYCGACKSIGAVMLACSKLFQTIPNVMFARIDVSKNILPWHLTFTHVPQIIFHPSRRKAETEVFDSTHEVTLLSLVTFLLSKFDAKTRLKFVCQQEGMRC